MSFAVLATCIMWKLPSRCALLSSTSCLPSSISSFSASTHVLASLLSDPRGPPLRALQAALSCRIRAGSSKASDRPPQVTGGVLRGPHTGEREAPSGQTPTSTPTPRPESRILRSGPQSPSKTGILTPYKGRWVTDECEESKKNTVKKKNGREKWMVGQRNKEGKRDDGRRSSLSGSHGWERGGQTEIVASLDVGQRNKDRRERQN